MRFSLLAIGFVTIAEGYSATYPSHIHRAHPQIHQRGSLCMLEDAHQNPRQNRRWEYDNVVKPNARFLSKIIEDERIALEQLEELMREYPPSCPAADLPEDIFG